jgi:hypothetical protein
MARQTANRTPAHSTSAEELHRRTAAELQQLKERQAFDANCLEWCNRIRNEAGKKFFHIRQFINCPEDEEVGSRWQKMHTDWLNVPEDQIGAFWNRSPGGGKAMARLTLNRRKGNVTNTVKKEFVGKWGWVNF